VYSISISIQFIPIAGLYTHRFFIIIIIIIIIIIGFVSTYKDDQQTLQC